MSLKNIGDRVNSDSAKNIRVSNAEEALLGLLLLFEEYRHEAASGKLGLEAGDFSTGFGRRVYEALCTLENSEGGFSHALLGQMFSVDEMGRIQKMEQDRQRLENNSHEVLVSLAETVRAEKEKQGGDPFGDLARMRERIRIAKSGQKEST